MNPIDKRIYRKEIDALQAEGVEIAQRTAHALRSHAQQYGRPAPIENAAQRIEAALRDWQRVSSLRTAQHVLVTTIEVMTQLGDHRFRHYLGEAQALNTRWQDLAGPFRTGNSPVALTADMDAHERYHTLINGFVAPLNQLAETGNADARLLSQAIAERLARHRDVFDPACLSIERHRTSASQGTVTLHYEDDHGALCLGLREPDTLFPHAQAGLQGGSDAYWQGIARSNFNAGARGQYRTRTWDEVRAELFKVLEMSLGLESESLAAVRDQVEEILSEDAPYEFANYRKWRLATSTESYTNLESFTGQYRAKPGWLEIPMGDSVMACFANEAQRAVVTCDQRAGECLAVRSEAYTEDGFGDALRRPVRLSLMVAPDQSHRLVNSFINQYGGPAELLRQHDTQEVQLDLMAHEIPAERGCLVPTTSEHPQLGMAL